MDKLEQERIDEITQKYNCDPGSLIQVLLEIQEEYNWLSEERLRRIGERLHLPLQQVRHAATFYKAFSLVPRGQHTIHICMGTACHVRGAERVLNYMKQITGTGPGETDHDLNFTLKTVNCLGCCAIGPVTEIDGKLHGKMTPDKANNLLKGYKQDKA
jgi:NADH-quinone oxidoreductase subunit E